MMVCRGVLQHQLSPATRTARLLSGSTITRCRQLKSPWPASSAITRRRSYVHALSAHHSRGVMRRTLFAPMVGLWPSTTKKDIDPRTRQLPAAKRTTGAPSRYSSTTASARSGKHYWIHRGEPVSRRIPRGIDRESEISDDQLHSAAHPRVVWITVISSGPTGSAHQSPAVNRPPKVVMAVIGLTAAARMARDRRTHERVILLAIVLAAAVDVAREGKVRSVTRLIAWDRQRTLAQKRQVKAPRS